jgi:hypothetical protein
MQGNTISAHSNSERLWHVHDIITAPQRDHFSRAPQSHVVI